MPVDMSKISKGKQDRKRRVLVYGGPAVGKTTFAAGAPNPFVIDADKGSHKLDVQRVVPATWSEAREWITAVETGAVKCDTLVLDSITELEALSHAEIFNGVTIDRWEDGWGKGDTYALQVWREVIVQLERVWMSGKNIVLVAHATVKKFADPSAATYDRFEVAARPKLAGLLLQSMDYAFFCREDILLSTDKAKTTRATTTGIRYAYTSRRPAYDAKARGSTAFPEKFPLSWQEFDSVVKNDAAQVDLLLAEIDKMLSQLADPKLAEQVKGYIKEYPSKTVEAHNRVAARLEEKLNATAATTPQPPTQGEVRT